MRKKRDAGFFPVLINLRNFPCLVVGGGVIASQKVLSLMAFNADITVISPNFSKPLIDLSKKREIKLIRKVYSADIINNYKFVFCATDNPELNKKVHMDCAKKGILINVADNPQLCDFILPANIKRGDLTISVSSQGKAPFYSRAIKKKLENIITPMYKDIMDLAGEFRKKLLTELSGPENSNGSAKSAKLKSEMIKKFTSTDWEKSLAEIGKRNSKSYIEKILNGT